MTALIEIHWSKAKGLVVIPTSAKTTAGFWMNVEPVEVVPIDRRGQIADAIRRIALAPVRTIPTPPRNGFPEPVVLKHGKVRSWSQFHWSYSLLHLSAVNGDAVSVQTLEKCADGSYQPNRDETARVFPTLDAAIAAIIEEIEKPE
jgi:hypothetical protein